MTHSSKFLCIAEKIWEKRYSVPFRSEWFPLNELLESIRNGKFKPSSVRRVEIPKENGAVRKLMAM